jgi:putative PIN family toxin of toxin-antitoxin system
MTRVVLDTNVLVSALLFEAGRLAWLRHGWQSGRFTPVLAEPTTHELLRVLAYSKFHLDPLTIEQLLADLLPWCETWPNSLTPCGFVVRDPHDQMFLDLAVAAGVAALVSGDADLLALQDQCQSLLILDPAAFRLWLDEEALI